MSYNDLPEKIREALERELGSVESDREYAAGVLLDSVNEDSSYDENLAGAIMEIVRETNLDFYIDDGEVVLDQNRA
jgi:hypothetical protein